MDTPGSEVLLTRITRFWRAKRRLALTQESSLTQFNAVDEGSTNEKDVIKFAANE